MAHVNYENRRGEIATYFDDTAVEAWEKLTSDAPVSRIRATVRAGRLETQSTLLSWLPEDLRGRRILDAGCGTGVLAVELARRGADVVAIDLSPKLVQMARQRMLENSASLAGRIVFDSGDMLDDQWGRFDHVVAMDSLIHYESSDMLDALSGLVDRTSHSVLFTFAPRTALLSLMHKAGKLFPKQDRSPSIVPIAITHLHKQLIQSFGENTWSVARNHRIDSGFYKSHAQELVRESFAEQQREQGQQ
jgi:magnesium-protoporphyrin O-methyltransferase